VDLASLGDAAPIEQTIAYALESPGQEPEPERAQTVRVDERAAGYPEGLTECEVEVLRLAAQGLTSARVAERLVISPVTVNTHLRNIYNKMGSTRAARRSALQSSTG
jgi:DNA-binding NarL/FixJ family response regulator